MITKFTKAPFEDVADHTQWPAWTSHYHDYKDVIQRNNSVVNQILKHMPIKGGRQYFAVDVRHQILLPTHWSSGFGISDEDGWHKDTERDPDALHHVYIIGENRTIFKIDEIATPMPQGYYATYDSQALHTAVQSSTAEHRLFIRLCETNVQDVVIQHLRDYYMEQYLSDHSIATITTEQIIEYFGECS